MNALKATALILIAAILNPLCCCLELFAKDVPDSHQMPAAHSCCTASSMEKQEPTAPAHASDVCPHAYDDQTQINDTHEAHAPLLKLQLVTSVVEQILAPDLLPQRVSRVSISSLHTPLPPAAPFSEAYCVYTL